MHIFSQGVGHLFPANIGYGVQCQTVVGLVHVVQIFPERVDHQTDEVGVLVHEQRQSQVTLQTRFSV